MYKVLDKMFLLNDIKKKENIFNCVTSKKFMGWGGKISH